MARGGIMPVMVVLAIGIAGIMIGGSGFADVWGQSPPQVEGASDQVNSSSSNVSPNEGPVEGPVNDQESSIVGIVVDGGSTLVDLAGAVIVLPLTLMNLGFPGWFAIPIGAGAEILVGISIIEFFTQRDWN